MSAALGLFEGYGIELEYMIVDAQNLNIQPIADEILSCAAGTITSDFIDGDVTWSNELALHVIELKTSGPVKSLNGLENSFLRSLRRMKECLVSLGSKGVHARLLPSAMHPLMRPDEVKLWPHDNNDIYDTYDRIFSCRGHGWSNLQSMHINLPFRDDVEFERLHTAIRFLLPILPSLAASSPIVEGHTTGSKDSRLLHYQQNQIKIPSIAGQVIPEPVRSMVDYKSTILEKIYQDIAPHDPEELLRDDWLNSRGAIARFERQTIEIRILDLQETPSLDLAIADFIVGLLKYLVAQPDDTRGMQYSIATTELKSIFDRAVANAEAGDLNSDQYLKAWSAPTSIRTIGDLFSFLFAETTARSQMSPRHIELIAQLLKCGSLSTRLMHALGSAPSPSDIIKTYGKLADCLDRDQMFQP